MKAHRYLRWVLAGVLFMLVAGVVYAFSIGNVDGTWGYIDGVTETSSTGQPNSAEGAICSRWATGNGDGATTTSNWNTAIQTPPNTDENQVRYGGDGCSACQTFANQSGFGFDGNNSVGTPGANVPFYLGKFTHYNNPITASSCGDWAKFYGVDLTVTVPLVCNDGTTSTSFSFVPHFALDETPNTAGTCVYPGTTVCPDKVTVTQPAASTFTCPDGTYTVNILGFQPQNANDPDCSDSWLGTAQTEFVTEENSDNVGCLWAEISAPTCDIAPVKTCVDFNTSNPYYRIVTTNAGPGSAAQPQFVDTFPSGAVLGAGTTLTYTSQLTTSSGTVAQGSCSRPSGSQTVTCKLLTSLPATTVDPAAKWTVDIYFAYFTTGEYLNSATVSTITSEPTGNNTASSGSCTPTGVDLLSLGATAGKRSVLLKWETTDAVDHVGFNLYRARTAAGPRTQVNEDLIPSSVNPGSAEGAVYTYEDMPMEGSGTYFYFVETVSISGETQLYGPVEVRLAK